MAELHTLEDTVHATATALYANLLTECTAYKGFAEKELQELLKSTCACTLAERRDAATSQLTQSRTFLKQQGECWSNAVGRIGAFWVGCLRAVEEQEAEGKAAEKCVRKTLKLMRQEIESEDVALEAALAEALTTVRRAFSEEDLDGKVAGAIARLVEMEDGYRSACARLVKVAMAYPAIVSAHHDRFHVRICKWFMLVPNVADPDTAAPMSDGTPLLSSEGVTMAADLTPSKTPLEGGGHASTAEVVAPLRVPHHEWARSHNLLTALLQDAPACHRGVVGTEGCVVLAAQAPMAGAAEIAESSAEEVQAGGVGALDSVEQVSCSL
jgi:hypothetical protein